MICFMKSAVNAADHYLVLWRTGDYQYVIEDRNTKQLQRLYMEFSEALIILEKLQLERNIDTIPNIVTGE